MNKQLSLRAQHGLSYSDYKSFQLPLESTAGQSIKEKKAALHEDVRKLDDYRDKSLINKFNLRSMITLPLIQPYCSINGVTKACNEVVGVICVYPNDTVSAKELPSLLNCLIRLSNIMAQTYIHSINYDQLRIRNEIFEFALSSTDLSSFSHRLSSLLQMKWQYEGVSIFLLDERSNTLKLRGTTGLNEKEVKSKTFFHLNEIDIVTNVFNLQESILIAGQEILDYESRYTESVSGEIVSVLCIPVFEPKTLFNNPKKCIGVLRLTNKVLQYNNKREAVSFGVEDISLLTFVASIVGVISHLFGKVSRMSEDFERSIHGIQNNLLFVNASLNQLQERSDIENTLRDTMFSYHIPDCIHHVQALSWQIERFTHGKNPGNIEYKPVKLVGDVLSKLPPIYRTMTRFFNATPKKSHIFEQDKIHEIPLVLGDVEALLTVFRNLTENAVKYSSRDVDLDVNITISVDSEHVYVHFSDNGIGIEDGAIDYIFSEGYKAENAMRRSTIGAGLGLFQCKKILHKMKADIFLMNNAQPTIFSVKLLRWGKE